MAALAVAETIYPPDPLPPVLLGASINLLAGAPGTGKSTFLAWMSRQVQDRTPLWGRQWGPIPWHGIICADRSWQRSTSMWFTLEGMEQLPAYSLQDDRGFRKGRLRRRDQRIGVFEHALDALAPLPGKQYPLGSLVYVDPLAIFLGGNLLDYDTCAVACSELREICLDRGLTIIGTAHASKQRNDPKDRYLRLQDRILGSTALFGYTDTQMYIASPEEVGKPYYGFLWHPHHAPPATFKFLRGPDGRFKPDGVVEDKAPPAGLPSEEAPSFPEWLQDALSSGPKSTSELIMIAQANSTSRATLNRLLQALQGAGTICKPRHGQYALSSTH